MASGSYARSMPKPGAIVAPTRAGGMLPHPWGRPSGFWGEPWVLCLTSALCILAVVLATGLLNPQPISSTSITASGGQSYAIQVGGDQAGSWQHDHPASIPIPRATPAPQPSTAPYSVAARPSIQVDFINMVLSAYRSPAAGKGQALYDLGVQYGIDPAFALDFFLHESTMGTRGEATKSLSLGNLRCIPNYRCEDNFAQFDSWEDGFKAWYQLMRNLYVGEWGLLTVDQIIPRYAPQADHNDEAGYIAALKHAIDTWHAGQIMVT